MNGATQGFPLSEVSGVYKCQPEDFEVIERLPFAPEGEGEHVFLHLRKRDRNTRQVLQQLAELAGVPLHHVGYAGLKDRFAVTTQWFSVHLPGAAEPDWRRLESEQLTLLEVARHRKKLRTGAHSGNDFRLVLRHIQGDPHALECALEQVRAHGFPNFFGEQRFGIGGSNLAQVASFGPLRRGRLSSRQKMTLSAVRSALFNEVLAARVADGSWQRALSGDLIQLDGSNSFFGPVTELDPSLDARLNALEVHPTGPLPGADSLPSGLDDPALERVLPDSTALEHAVLQRHPDYLELLARLDVRSARRALRTPARELRWQRISETSVRLEFTLDRGSYATELLRRLGHFQQAQREKPAPTQVNP